jgi:hypothetical protein
MSGQLHDPRRLIPGERAPSSPVDTDNARQMRKKIQPAVEMFGDDPQ